MASPMPRVPPVTTATCPFMSLTVYLRCCRFGGPESAGHVLARGIRDGLVPPAAHGRRLFAFACPAAGHVVRSSPPRAAVLGGRSAPGLGNRIHRPAGAH